MTAIVYCKNCGAYLGENINGVLYKFGRVVTTEHTCQRHLAEEDNTSLTGVLP